MIGFEDLEVIVVYVKGFDELIVYIKEGRIKFVEVSDIEDFVIDDLVMEELGGDFGME